MKKQFDTDFIFFSKTKVVLISRKQKELEITVLAHL